MRIAVLAASRIPSRTANSIQVMQVCQSMAELGHEVRLLVPGTGQVEWPDLAEHYALRRRFDIRWIPSLAVLRRYDFCWKAVLIARRWGAEVVYAFALPAAAMAARRGNRVVLELHELPSGRLGPAWLRMFLRGRGRRRLVCISRGLQRAVQEGYPADAARVETTVLPMGVDLERYRSLPAPAEARRRLGLAPRPTAMYTGHLYRGRGISLLLEVAGRVPRTEMVCVGGEEEAVRFWREQAARAGRRNIHFVGHVPQAAVAMYQAAGDVLLMPYERVVAGSSGGDTAGVASPMKMFEYLAAARPILAAVPTDGEAAALIRETRAGAVVAPDDVDGLTAALADLEARWRAGDLGDTELSAEARERISRRARAEELAALLRSLP
jgi:glycosyltransferase involved in cell wall biosynthesis